MSSWYSEKLKDPRWQKKRLEVLERAGWKCQCCGDEGSTLHVHHLVYIKGDPWESPDDTLECLCEECHELRTRFDELIKGVEGKRGTMSTSGLACFMKWVSKAYAGDFGHAGQKMVADCFHGLRKMRRVELYGPDPSATPEKEPAATASNGA